MPQTLQPDTIRSLYKYMKTRQWYIHIRLIQAPDCNLESWCKTPRLYSYAPWTSQAGGIITTLLTSKTSCLPPPLWTSKTISIPRPCGPHRRVVFLRPCGLHRQVVFLRHCGPHANKSCILHPCGPLLLSLQRRLFSLPRRP